MKKAILTLFILIGVVSVQNAHAQAVDFGFRLGAAYYVGDLSGTGATNKWGPMNIQFSQPGFTVGINARKFFTKALAAQVELNYTRVRGTDALSENPTHYSRNLSFRTGISELAVRGEWHFFNLEDVGRTYRYKLSFSPYIFAGASVFHFNPKAEYNGSYVALRELETEGVKYSPISMSVLAGLAFEFRIDKQHVVGFEITGRRAFTDYIDDVSTNYLHYSSFDDPTALALQDRSIELEGSGDPLFIGSDQYSYGTNKSGGAVRGNPKYKDYYSWTGVYYKYALRDKRRNFNQRKYSFARRKVRNRRSRAKF
ncbi:MAG: DUF6089 family protein [Salibacteraceae bacterium]